jgi:chemotaxis protein CheD
MKQRKIAPAPAAHGSARVVDIGQLAVSSDPADTLITYELGSCLGVTAYDRVARVGALAHLERPLTPAHAEEAQRWPATFVETGVAHMLETMYARGARKERIELRAAGGSRSASEAVEECFELGRRNVVALKKVLWQHGVLIRAHEVGGTVSRTLSLRVEDGLVVVATHTTSRALGGDLPCI